MKLVFFGTSSRSANFLTRVIAEGLKPSFVISTPPKPIGRGKTPTENPTVATAKKLGLPTLTDNSYRFRIKSGMTNEPILGLILDFNQIIPQKVIDLFSKGIINIHFSKLPKDRGPARGAQFILRGENKAWISYYLITAGLDEGPLLSQTSLPLNGRETYGELSDKLVGAAATEIKPIIKSYLAGEITPRPQQGKPTYVRKLTKKDFFIPPETLKAAIAGKQSSDEAVRQSSILSRPYTLNPLPSAAHAADRLIRAGSPAPGAWSLVNLKPQASPVSPLANRGRTSIKLSRLKILKAHLESDKLVLDIVQLEGKNPVTWKQFLEGYPKTNLS